MPRNSPGLRKPKNIRPAEWASLPDHVKEKLLLRRRETEEKAALMGNPADFVKGMASAEAGLPMDMAQLVAPGAGTSHAQRLTQMRPGGHPGYEEQNFVPEYSGTSEDIYGRLGGDPEAGAGLLGQILTPGLGLLGVMRAGTQISKLGGKISKKFQGIDWQWTKYDTKDWDKLSKLSQNHLGEMKEAQKALHSEIDVIFGQGDEATFIVDGQGLNASQARDKLLSEAAQNEGGVVGRGVDMYNNKRMADDELEILLKTVDWIDKNNKSFNKSLMSGARKAPGEIKKGTSYEEMVDILAEDFGVEISGFNTYEGSFGGHKLANKFGDEWTSTDIWNLPAEASLGGNPLRPAVTNRHNAFKSEMAYDNEEADSLINLLDKIDHHPDARKYFDNYHPLEKKGMFKGQAVDVNKKSFSDMTDEEFDNY